MGLLFFTVGDVVGARCIGVGWKIVHQKFDWQSSDLRRKLKTYFVAHWLNYRQSFSEWILNLYSICRLSGNAMVHSVIFRAPALTKMFVEFHWRHCHLSRVITVSPSVEHNFGSDVNFFLLKENGNFWGRKNAVKLCFRSLKVVDQASKLPALHLFLQSLLAGWNSCACSDDNLLTCVRGPEQPSWISASQPFCAHVLGRLTRKKSQNCRFLSRVIETTRLVESCMCGPLRARDLASPLALTQIEGFRNYHRACYAQIARPLGWPSTLVLSGGAESTRRLFRLCFPCFLFHVCQWWKISFLRRDFGWKLTTAFGLWNCSISNLSKRMPFMDRCWRPALISPKEITADSGFLCWRFMQFKNSYKVRMYSERFSFQKISNEFVYFEGEAVLPTHSKNFF